MPPTDVPPGRLSTSVSCFEVLGYDILVDHTLRPWLIEVNHSPSFNIDTPLDLKIKEELITNTLALVRPARDDC